MSPLLFVPILGLLLVSISPAFAEPYSPSCRAAIEKLSKSQKALVPFQRTMERARARERGAYGELAFCTGGGIYSVNKAVRCSEAKWQAPERTRELVEAEDQYQQKRQAFVALLERVRGVCLEGS